MSESTHILNRSVVFTDIPGAPRLPKDTRLVVKTNSPYDHDVIAVTPAGQRYEFKSMHIGGLIRSPWVVPQAGDIAKTPVPAKAVRPEPVKENPFTLGDVSSVEEGIGNDVLPRVDVTGSSSSEDFGKSKMVEDEVVDLTPVATETVVDMGPSEEVEASSEEEEEASEPESSDATVAPKTKGRKKGK